MGENQVTCPSCHQTTTSLRQLSESLLQKLAEEGMTQVPSELCESCYQSYAGRVAKGAVLLAEFKAREQRKLMMWKSRVNLLKKARALMKERAFADAAIAYEKYLKVLETVYDVKSNELTPEHLKSTARTQELTVIASVYWDLLRIYDTSDRYTSRMEVVARKLAEFVPYTPLLPDIVKRAQSFEKVAKKGYIIKSLIKSITEKKSRCFIASATYHSYYAPEVLLLQQWRDEVLQKTWHGRMAITIYYVVAPPFADLLTRYPILQKPMRLILDYVVKIIKNRLKNA